MNQSPKNFIKVMEANGWICKRINGSHHVMVHPNMERAVVVPMHGNRDIPKGLFHSMIKQSKLTISDFE